MKRFLRYLKQQTWLMVLPLLLMTAGTTALAAQTPSFSATTSGTTNNLTLTANLNVGDADVGKNGNVYLGFTSQQIWYFNNGAGWLQYSSGELPIYSARSLANQSIVVVSNQDLSSLVGAQLYVGYGLTESDMMANSKYAMVYTVRADTTPIISGTLHTNGQTNVPINTSVGLTFNEAMAPSTINSTNFTLKQTVSGAAVTGTVSYTGVNATFTPSANLASNTSYTVTIKGGASGVKDLAGHPMTDDFTISWTTGTTADTTAPTVSTTLHTNGQTDVPINTSVGLAFSEWMDPATITSTNFTLKQTASGAAVSGTVSHTGVSAAFTPSSNLASNTNYTVTVKGGAGGVKDLAGNTMASDFVITWTTSSATDNIAPTVTGSTQANAATGVVRNAKVGITFSEGMDPATITNTNFEVSETRTANAVAGTVSYSGVNAIFIPLSDFDYSKAYTVTVHGGSNGVKDLAGNAMASDSIFRWTTVGIPSGSTDPVAADTTAPTVTGTTNANGATNVAVNTHVGATFSEAMDPLTITNVNFTLKETVSGNAVAGTVSYSSSNAVFIPLSNLTNNISYTATIKGGVSGAKDLAGNALASDYVWSWTTAALTDTTAPTVTGTTIANLATNVAIDTTVGATFSEGIDPLTMTNLNFTLKETISGTAVVGLVSFSGGNWIFTPSSNLANNTSYTATISGAKDLAGNTLASDYVWSFTTIARAGPAMVDLATAGNFAILTKAQITDVPSSPITGDVGASPITAASIHLTCAEMAAGSKIYGVDAAFTTDPVCYHGLAADKTYVDTAVGHMETAYTDAAGRPAGTGAFLNAGAGNLGGQILVPGVYTFTGASINVTIPTDLTLAGGPNDTWIFQIPGTLDLSANKQVLLSGGAKAKNIVWQVAGSVTLQAGSHFEGVILGGTNIAMITGATINGRLLSQTEVTLQQNTVTQPAP